MKFSKIALSTLPVALLALGLTSTSAYATTVTNTFQVTATVQASCNITPSSGGLAFGNYLGEKVTAQTTITVNCNTAGTQYSIGLNSGQNGTAPYARNMINGANKLQYGIYQDGGLTTNWGTTTGTGGDVATGNSTANPSVIVYGVIPAAQVVPTGSYSDTITATITY